MFPQRTAVSGYTHRVSKVVLHSTNAFDLASTVPIHAMASPADTCSSVDTVTDGQATTYVFDDDGDLLLSFSDGRLIQVCTGVVSTVTTFFDHLRTVSTRRPDISSFEATEYDAILLFCKICYHRGHDIPQQLDVQTLGRVAVVAMDFDCVGAFVPWIDIWCNGLYKNRPTTQTLLDLLAVAYILDDDNKFKLRSRDLILQTGEEFPYRAFPNPMRLTNGNTELHNQLPIGVLGKCHCLYLKRGQRLTGAIAAVHEWRQGLRWNLQRSLELSIAKMVDCSCSVAGLFYLRELRRHGLWPLTGRGSILQIRNLLVGGSVVTFVPPEGVENCQNCQPVPFTAVCREIGNGINVGAIGLDLDRWKDLDESLCADTDLCQSRKRPRCGT